MQQHTTNHLIKKAMAGEYEDGIVECHVKISRQGQRKMQISLTDEHGEDLVFWDPIEIRIGDNYMIQNIRFLQNLILEEGFMAEGKENKPLYEVFILFDTTKGKGKDKSTEEDMIGPIRVRAKTELSAMLGVLTRKGKPNMTVAQYEQLCRADLSSFEVKAKRV